MMRECRNNAANALGWFREFAGRALMVIDFL
jgi:hypothetical protein